MSTLANDRKKKLKSAVAVATAAALLISGTFAWQSISQTALNQLYAVSNPGGRLHDDFDGVNKNVYVENFTDKTGGLDIYARVKLTQYMEIGDNAGQDLENDKRYENAGVTSVVDGAKYSDKSTWTPYFGSNNASGTKTDLGEDGTGIVLTNNNSELGKYFEWTVGGEVNYMPTFNKNKDSLVTDINGTLKGANTLDAMTYYEENDTLNGYYAYSDYVKWKLSGDNEDPKTENGVQVNGGSKSSMEGFEIWDGDSDDSNDEVIGTETTYEGMSKKYKALIEGTAANIKAQVEGEELKGQIKVKNTTVAGETTTYSKVKHEVTTTVKQDANVMSMATYTEKVAAAKTALDKAESAYKSSQSKSNETALNEAKTAYNSAKTGNFWVYDTDGWAYWAAPIKPQTATTALLNDIGTIRSDLETKYFYNVNVEGQFITAGDSGKQDGTGFWYTSEDKPTLRAENLLENIGVDLTKQTDSDDSSRQDAKKTSAVNSITTKIENTKDEKATVTSSEESGTTKLTANADNITDEEKEKLKTELEEITEYDEVAAEKAELFEDEIIAGNSMISYIDGKEYYVLGKTKIANNKEKIAVLPRAYVDNGLKVTKAEKDTAVESYISKSKTLESMLNTDGSQYIWLNEDDYLGGGNKVLKDIDITGVAKALLIMKRTGNAYWPGYVGVVKDSVAYKLDLQSSTKTIVASESNDETLLYWQPVFLLDVAE